MAHLPVLGQSRIHPVCPLNPVEHLHILPFSTVAGWGNNYSTTTFLFEITLPLMEVETIYTPG